MRTRLIQTFALVGLLACGGKPVPGGGAGGGGGGEAGGAGGGGGPTACVPKTCEGLGKNCGEIDDGCGDRLDCGDALTACEEGATCGGGGIANVCGAECALGCPSGFTCDLKRGVCAGGSAGSLPLDLRATVRLSGKITVNGVDPTTTCTSGNRATLRLAEKGATRTYFINLPCGDGSGPFLVDATVYPGTYRVAVRAPGSPELSADYIPMTPAELTLNADVADARLEVKPISVEGMLTLNGALIPHTCTTISPATLTFTEVASNATSYLAVPCNAAAPYSFQTKLAPGTYRVSVRGASGSALPTNTAVVAPSLSLLQSERALSLDVKTVGVAGVVTLNGQQPTTTCTTASRGTVRFVETMSKVAFSFSIPCNQAMGAFAFEGGVFPGTYTVSVSGASTSNLPGAAVVVNPALVLSGDQLNLALDVRAFTISGDLTLNGAAPTATCSGASTTATVTFTELATKAVTSGFATCANPFHYAVSVGPGTYSVKVRGSSSTNLPVVQTLAIPSLVVSSDRSGVNLDVATASVKGVVTVNGMMPTTTCTGTLPRGYVDFIDDAHAITATLPLPCNGAQGATTFDGVVGRGIWRVVVRGNGTTSNLLAKPYTVDSALNLTGDRALTLDQKVVQIAGALKLNGATPVLTGTCSGVSGAATVTLTDASVTPPATVSIPVPCAGAPPFSFSATVLPGAYRVAVRGSTLNRSNLPTSDYQVHASLNLTSDQTALDLDVKALQVGGQITLAGMVPTSSCTTPTSSRASVRFVNLANNASTLVGVPCDGTVPFQYQGSLFPAVYRVIVSGASTSNLSTSPVMVIDKVELAPSP